MLPETKALEILYKALLLKGEDAAYLSIDWGTAKRIANLIVDECQSEGKIMFESMKDRVKTLGVATYEQSQHFGYWGRVRKAINDLDKAPKV